MPALVNTKVPAKSLQTNDVIVYEVGTITVVKAEMKTKYTHVTVKDGDGNDNIVHFPNDELVEVRRSQITDVEMTDTLNRATARWARDGIANASARVLTAKEELINDLDYRPGLHRSRYVDYVIAQTEAAIWRKVKQYASRDDISIIDALHEVRDELTDELVNVRHESRSTSGSSNMVDDVECDTKAAWLRTLKYKLPPRGDTRYM